MNEPNPSNSIVVLNNECKLLVKRMLQKTKLIRDEVESMHDICLDIQNDITKFVSK